MIDDHLKHRFLEINQVSFYAGPEAENEFKVPWESLKNRFFDITQTHFELVKRQEMSSQRLVTT